MLGLEAKRHLHESQSARRISVSPNPHPPPPPPSNRQIHPPPSRIQTISSLVIQADHLCKPDTRSKFAFLGRTEKLFKSFQVEPFFLGKSIGEKKLGGTINGVKTHATAAT